MFSKIQLPQSNTSQHESQNCDKSSCEESFRSKMSQKNKKLEQIAQLQTKNQRKLEQQEKVSKKDQLISERGKQKELMKTSVQSTSEEQIEQNKNSPSELQNLAYLKATQEKNMGQGNSFYPKYSAECCSNQSQPISPRSEIQRETEIQYLEQEQIEDTLQRNQQIQQPLTPQFRQCSLHLDEVNKQIYQIEIHQPLIQGKKNVRKNEKEKSVENKQNDRTENISFGQKRATNPRFTQNKSSKQKRRTILRASNKDEQDQYESESEQQVGDFKKKSMREFIQNGFISAGKAKIKSKDQKQYHDHQHGKKHHHNHHSKKNF